MNSFSKIVGMTLMLFFAISTSFAQINSEDEKVAAAVRAEFEVVSKKIEDVFNKNPKIRDGMQNRLKAINIITDTTKFRLAVEDYRSAYLTTYGNIVKTAGVDMNDFVKQMTAKFPAYIFNVQNNYGIAFSRSTSAESDQLGVQALSVTTTTTAITGFLQTRETGCALGSGSSITFPTRSVKATSWAAVAGGCSASGDLTKNVTLPSMASKILLRLAWKQRISAYAVGVIGVATGLASTSSLTGVGNESALISSFKREMAIAPFLWVTSFDKEFPFDITKDITTSKGKILSISFSGYSSTISGACCATSATGQTTYSRADLIVTN